jgi:hypothetical protein
MGSTAARTFLLPADEPIVGWGERVAKTAPFPLEATKETRIFGDFGRLDQCTTTRQRRVNHQSANPATESNSQKASDTILSDL